MLLWGADYSLHVIFTPHFAPNASLQKQGMGAAGLIPSQSVILTPSASLRSVSEQDEGGRIYSVIEYLRYTRDDITVNYFMLSVIREFHKTIEKMGWRLKLENRF